MQKQKNESMDLRVFKSAFTSITLDELNTKAAMLERNENKYVFALADLSAALADLQKEFDILTIEGKQEFMYETIYFDTKDHLCYRQHTQKARKRFKARTRRYVDADLCFFEVKLKDLRGKTNKKRIVYTHKEHGTLNTNSHQLLAKSFKNIYKQDFMHRLVPSTKMTYKRITLVAKKGGERMTIDYSLTFYDTKTKKKVYTPKDFIIIETKSATGNGIADKIFKKHRQRSTSCSKFCLSKIMLKHVDKYNTFLPLLKKNFPDFIASKK